MVGCLCLFAPARASSSDRAMQVGADFLARAERAGQPLPANDPDRPAIMRSLQLGLVTRNAEFSSLGIMNREVAMEAAPLRPSSLRQRTGVSRRHALDYRARHPRPRRLRRRPAQKSFAQPAGLGPVPRLREDPAPATVTQFVFAPSWNQRAIIARSSSVISVMLPNGMTRVTATC